MATKSKAKLTLHKARVTESDLPARAWCRVGTKDSKNKVTWNKPQLLELAWCPHNPLVGKATIEDETGSYWSEFIESKALYHRGQKECLQIYQKTGNDVFLPSKLSGSDELYHRYDESNSNHLDEEEKEMGEEDSEKEEKDGADSEKEEKDGADSEKEEKDGSDSEKDEKDGADSEKDENGGSDSEKDEDNDEPVDSDAVFLKTLQDKGKAVKEYQPRGHSKVHYVADTKVLKTSEVSMEGEYLPGDVVTVSRSKSGFPRFVYIIDSIRKVAEKKKNCIDCSIEADFFKLERVNKKESNISLKGQERYIPGRLIDKFGVTYWAQLKPDEGLQCDFYTQETLDRVGHYVLENKDKKTSTLREELSKDTLPSECISKEYLVAMLEQYQ